MTMCHVLLIIAFVVTSQIGNTRADVAESIRGVLGINCSSFTDCAFKITQNGYQLIDTVLQQNYGVTMQRGPATNERTWSLPPITFNVTVPKEKLTLLRLYAPSVVDFNRPASLDKLQLSITLSNTSIATRGFSLNLKNPGEGQYLAHVSADSLVATSHVTVGDGQTELLSTTLNVNISGLSLPLGVIVSMENGQLKITDCATELAMKSVSLQATEPSLQTPMSLANLILNQPATAAYINTKICPRVVNRANDRLVSRNADKTQTAQVHHHGNRQHHHGNH